MFLKQKIEFLSKLNVLLSNLMFEIIWVFCYVFEYETIIKKLKKLKLICNLDNVMSFYQ